MRTIHDAVYGPVELDEPLLEAMLDTAALQRLRGVSQSGISGMLGIAPDFSRYEHSVGVLLLLRRLGASLKEQAAGLLHDISHTAFSHVSDFVYAEHNVSYHERMWPVVMARSELPTLLAAHGFDWHELEADVGPFTLLEQPQPRLCADRVDYFLRTVVPAGLGSPADLAWACQHIVAHAGEIVLDDLAAARWLGDLYLRMDETMWSSPREVALYWVLARAMQRAVEKGHIQEQDWYGTDQALWAQLQRIQEPQIEKLLSYVRADTVVLTDSQEHDFVTEVRVRAVDPPLLVRGELVPLSALDSDFAARRAAHLAARRRPLALWVTRPDSQEEPRVVRVPQAGAQG